MAPELPQPQLPEKVLKAYRLKLDTVDRIPSLINATFKARSENGSWLIVQRLHPVFGALVNENIDRVTRHLQSLGMVTPLLVPATGGKLWVEAQESERKAIWRALTFIPGQSFHVSESPEVISEAAALLGRFHSALASLRPSVDSPRPLHDTRLHLDALRTALGTEKARGDSESQRLGAEILNMTDQVRMHFDEEPRRSVHGDPKLSNLRFRPGKAPRGLCMLDLDTLGQGCLAFELGDALRSWCNPEGEDRSHNEIRGELFAAALNSYKAHMPAAVEPSELLAAVDGLRAVCLELASRFAADAIVDSYWGWDSRRYASRREHNLVRAKGQLSLAQSVQKQEASLRRIAQSVALGPRPIP